MQQLGRARILPLIAFLLLAATMGYVIFFPSLPTHTIMVEGAFGVAKPAQPGRSNQVALYLHLVNFGSEDDALTGISVDGVKAQQCLEVGKCSPMSEVVLPETEYTVIDPNGDYLAVTAKPEVIVMDVLLTFKMAPERMIKVPVRGRLLP